MQNHARATNPPLQKTRFQGNWLLTANGWVFEPIWWNQQRLQPMPSKDRATNPPPETPGGEGWLVSAEQQLLCQFKPDSATVHAQWVAVRTYRWVPPRPPVPKTRRRMLRHNAIEAWDKMLKTGWRRCSPPVR